MSSSNRNSTPPRFFDPPASAYWVFDPPADVPVQQLQTLVIDYVTGLQIKPDDLGDWAFDLKYSAQADPAMLSVTVGETQVALIDTENTLGPKLKMPLGSGVIDVKKENMLAILFVLGFEKYLPSGALRNSFAVAGEDDCSISVENEADAYTFLTMFSDLGIDKPDDVHDYRFLFEYFGVLKEKFNFLSMISQSADELPDDWI